MLQHLIYEASFSAFYENIRSDLKYAALLIVCVAVSTLFRLYVPAHIRVKVDGVLGLVLNIFVARWTTIYSLAAVLAHLVLYRVVRDAKYERENVYSQRKPLLFRLLGQISFFGTFAYLGVLRLVHFAGFPRLEFITNAIQLIMTLRVCLFFFMLGRKVSLLADYWFEL